MAKIDIMLPVYNEAASLRENTLRLRDYLVDLHLFPHTWQIIIVDNASTDTTQQLGETLAATEPGISYQRMERKGRGYALKESWRASKADVVAYMDIDLSTSLTHLPALLTPLLENQADVTFGSRLSAGSLVAGRKPFREVLSRSYNTLLQFAMAANFKDAQCGFKALRRDTFDYFYHNVKDNDWFFDTELLLRMQYAGYRLKEIPVTWLDDPGSTVHVRKTVIQDLQGMARVYRSERPYSALHRLTSFGVIGAISTIGYGVLYWLLNSIMPDQLANLITLIVLTLFNISLNRRFTYRKRGSEDIRRHYRAGFGAFLLAWFITGVGLWTVQGFYPNLTNAQEGLTVTSLSVLSTVLKYLVFSLGFRDKPPTAPTAAQPSHKTPQITDTRSIKEIA